MDQNKDSNEKTGPVKSKSSGDLIIEDKTLQPVFEYETAFDLTGYGRMNYVVLLACCMIFIYCSQEMSGMAYIITPAECDLKMNVNQKSLVNSGIYIGVSVSAICWGTLSDRYGRRKVMLPAMIGSMVTSFLSSLSIGFWTMFALRVITGCLVSASSATVLVYLSELHAKKYRDRAIAIAITSDQINFVIFPGIAWMVIPGQWSFSIASLVIKPWRAFMWTWAVTGLTGTILLFKLPESPKFLLATKGSIETISVLAQIYAWNKRMKAEDFPVKSINCDSQSMTFQKQGFTKFIADLSLLFRPPLRRCFLITHACMFMVNLLSNGLYMWMPALINETLKDIKRKASMCDLIYIKYMANGNMKKRADMLLDVGQWSSHTPHGDFPLHESSCAEAEVVSLTYPSAMAMELFYLGPYILIVICISKYKPNKIYAVIMSICAIALATCSVVPQILVATVLITLGLCSGGAASLLSALAIAAFPTRLRALSMCTMFMVGQFGTIAGICILGGMDGMFCQVLFFSISGLVMICTLVILFLWPDLKEVRREMENRMFRY